MRIRDQCSDGHRSSTPLQTQRRYSAARRKGSCPGYVVCASVETAMGTYNAIMITTRFTPVRLGITRQTEDRCRTAQLNVGLMLSDR